MFDLTETDAGTGERVLTRRANLLLGVAVVLTMWAVLVMVGAWVQSHASYFLRDMR